MSGAISRKTREKNRQVMRNFKLKRKSIALGCFLSGSNSIVTSSQLENLGYSAPQRTVRNWFLQFKNGNNDLEHKPMPGRPQDTDHDEKKFKLKEEMIQDRFVTYKELTAITGISTGSMSKMKKEIKVEKLKGIWVPHKLNEAQKKLRVDFCTKNLAIYNHGRLRKKNSIITGDETWMKFHTLYPGNKAQWVFDDEDYPKVAKESNTSNKRMFAIFFNSTGVVHSQFQEQGYAVKSVDYIDALKQVEEKLTESGITNPVLHQDNCHVHFS